MHTLAKGIADASTYGIRHDSIFHKFLSHFHATTGFPPDVSHDLLEGIVPFEVALCIGHFTEKRYFKDVQEINSILHQFHYLYTDAVNKPQSIPCNAVGRSSVGGNATKNRTLVRLFPNKEEWCHFVTYHWDDHHIFVSFHMCSLALDKIVCDCWVYENKSVAIIATAWLENDECYWPPAATSNAIRKDGEGMHWTWILLCKNNLDCINTPHSPWVNFSFLVWLMFDSGTYLAVYACICV